MRGIENRLGKVQTLCHELMEISDIVEFRAQTIHRLSDLFRSSTAAFFHWGQADGDLQKLRREDVQFWQLDPDYQNLYFALAAENDPLAKARSQLGNLPAVSTLTSVASKKELELNPLVTEILLPNQQHDVLGIYFVVQNKLQGHISLTRHVKDREYGGEEVQTAQLLAPFLTAAYSRLLLLQELHHQKAATSVLTSLCPEPICLLLDSAGEVVPGGTKPTTVSHPLLQPRVLSSLRRQIRNSGLDARPSGLASPGATSIDVVSTHNSLSDQSRRMMDYPVRHRVIEHGTDLYHLFSVDPDSPLYLAAKSTNHYGLTAREISVVEKIKQGCSTKEVAEQLSISRWTVKNHLQSIYSKVGVNSRVGLVAKFDDR